jgi:hypothetical protein
MKGHALADERARTRAFQEHRQELQGRLPSGPFEFSGSGGATMQERLSFADVKPADGDSSMVRRFKLAVARDARYAVASAPYLQIFGMSQCLRSIYDGGGQIQDGNNYA